MIAAGGYEGVPLNGKIQFGETGNGTLQIAVDLELFNAKNESEGVMTSFLYFSEASMLRSYECLRALGWTGSGPDDVTIERLTKECVNKVPCRVTAPESYEDPKTKEKKMGFSKCEIQAGAGQVILQKPLDANTFAARLKALGAPSGGSTSTGGGSGPTPPF